MTIIYYAIIANKVIAESLDYDALATWFEEQRMTTLRETEVWPGGFITSCKSMPHYFG